MSVRSQPIGVIIRGEGGGGLMGRKRGPPVGQLTAAIAGDETPGSTRPPRAEQAPCLQMLSGRADRVAEDVPQLLTAWRELAAAYSAQGDPRTMRFARLADQCGVIDTDAASPPPITVNLIQLHLSLKLARRLSIPGPILEYAWRFNVGSPRSARRRWRADFRTQVAVKISMSLPPRRALRSHDLPDLVDTYRSLAVIWQIADPKRAARFARLARQLAAINPAWPWVEPVTRTLLHR